MESGRGQEGCSWRSCPGCKEGIHQVWTLLHVCAPPDRPSCVLCPRAGLAIGIVEGTHTWTSAHTGALASGLLLSRPGTCTGDCPRAGPDRAGGSVLACRREQVPSWLEAGMGRGSVRRDSFPPTFPCSGPAIFLVSNVQTQPQTDLIADPGASSRASPKLSCGLTFEPAATLVPILTPFPPLPTG